MLLLTWIKIVISMLKCHFSGLKRLIKLFNISVKLLSLTNETFPALIFASTTSIEYKTKGENTGVVNY